MSCAGGGFEKAETIDTVTRSCCTILVLVVSSWLRLVAITLHSISIFFQEAGDCLWTLSLLLPNLGTFRPLLQTGVLHLIVAKARLCALVVVVFVVTIMRSNNGLYYCEFIFFLLSQSESKDQVCVWGGRVFAPWSTVECPPLPSPLPLCFLICCQVHVVVLDKCCWRGEWGQQVTNRVVDDRDDQLLKRSTTCFTTMAKIHSLYPTTLEPHLLGLC